MRTYRYYTALSAEGLVVDVIIDEQVFEDDPGCRPQDFFLPGIRDLERQRDITISGKDCDYLPDALSGGLS